MIPLISIDKMKEMIKSISLVRRGDTFKLSLGSVAYFCTDASVLASNASRGTTLFRPRRADEYSYPEAPTNFRVDTFIVRMKKRIRYDQPSLDREIEELAHQFVSYETTEVLKRIKNAEDVVYAEGDEVARLQKFFDDLNKSVVVLRLGETIDLSKNFTLVVRTDLYAEVFDDPVKLTMDIALGEDVGFFYNVD